LSSRFTAVSEFQIRRLTEHVPWTDARNALAAVSENQECRDTGWQEEPYKTAVELAALLDGFPRYPKQHPCGLVLSRDPIQDQTPVFISSKGYPTTHFEMESVESVGLVKMDILAQGGLAVIRDTLELLEEKGIRPDLERLEPWDDPAIWKMIATGEARGVHHIESPAMISLAKMCNARDIRYFFYVGGNDSADTVRIINEQAESTGYDFRAIHIPKTVDNDLAVNDHCPGYGSAGRFVAQAFMGLNLDNRALQGVLIGVVMGRHAGFLTATAVLARKYVEEGPHLIYLPERTFSKEKFLADVERVHREYGRCVVAVSEGIQDATGTPVSLSLSDRQEQDAHGNLQLSGTDMLGDLLAGLVRDNLKIKRVRADTFGYLQRSFMGVVSDRDAHEARELGEIAVQYAMWDNVDGSMVIRRPVLNYSVSYDLVHLSEVAGKTRTMPGEFINEDCNGVTEKFYSYCRPLMGSGFPESHRLRAPNVPKIMDS